MAKQESGKPYSHFVTRFRLSGDIERAKLLVKTGERQMGILRKQLRFHDLFQGYRDFEPFGGAMINCSIVGTVRLIEIYVQPTLPVKIKNEETRPCFCNCCLAECQIVKVDGTWRDDDHPEHPLPDLKYQYGDRRLRYDIDVCSFMGISAETGLLTYEFYRVENVMPSDFTRYEVGDWAMVYFTDLVRETECGKCEECTPPLNDELGRVWGCLPRDVAVHLNNPQCIILPIAIDDRISRGTVMYRPIASLRQGVCVKKCVIDWVQYSTRDEQGRVVDGYANIRWDAWTPIPGGTIVDNVPIRYCTQDGNNDDGSHAFRWGNEVYLFMEGDAWTIFGHVVSKLPTYKAPDLHGGIDVKMINPALIIVWLFTERSGYLNPDFVNPEIDDDMISWAWDFTHDSNLSFTRYAWAEVQPTIPTTTESLNKLLSEYFGRGSCDPPTSIGFMAQYGSVAANSWSVQPGRWSEISVNEWYLYPSSHSHGVYRYDFGSYQFTISMALQWTRDTEGFARNDLVWQTGSTAQNPYLTLPRDGSGDWLTGEYNYYLLDTQIYEARGWSKFKHISGFAQASTVGGGYIGLDVTFQLEASTSTPLAGIQMGLNGFSSSFERVWLGMVTKANCREEFDVYPGSGTWTHSYTATYTWEYLDLFYDRPDDWRSIYSGMVDCSGGINDYDMSVTAAIGIAGMLTANTSSITIKVFEARYDSLSATGHQGAYTQWHSFYPHFILFSPLLSATNRLAETRYSKVEIGSSKSRSHDPFPKTGDGTPYGIWDRPFLSSAIPEAIDSVKFKFKHIRDYGLIQMGNSPPPEDLLWYVVNTISYDPEWYQDSYYLEDKMKIRIW